MNAANENEVSEVELLLPWHAAGTLNHRDTQRVEAALASDPELARRYELVCEELGQTIELNESLGAPSARAMQALFAKLDAEPARARPVSLNAGARVREFFASLSPRTLAWSASAAAIAILLQAGVIAGIIYKANGPIGAANYQTASVTENVSGEGSYALIRFQPQANAADIEKFLESNKLSLAGGPLAGGLYRVQVAAKKIPQADLAGLVKKLQEDKVVGFIAPTE
jgi:anti-sigma factor RsiW